MTTIVRDLMTTDLVMCPADTALRGAAQLMRDRGIGDVLVTRNGRLAIAHCSVSRWWRAVARSGSSASATSLSRARSSSHARTAPSPPAPAAARPKR